METMRMPMNGLSAFFIENGRLHWVIIGLTREGRQIVCPMGKTVLHPALRKFWAVETGGCERLCELLFADGMQAAVGVVEKGEAIRVTVIDSGFVGAFRQAEEAGLFQECDPGIPWCHEADPGDDAFDGGGGEKGIDAGPEGRKVHGVFPGEIKGIDTDGSRLG